MKKTLCALLAVMSFSAAFAQSLDQEIGRKIDRLNQASGRGDIARLSRTEKDELNGLMDRALRVVRDDGRDGIPDDRRPGRDPIPGPFPGPGRDNDNRPGPIGGDWRRNMSYARNEVVAYSDDNCRNVVTEVKASDSCSRLTTIYNNIRVWSISVNGTCLNITDSSMNAKCSDMQVLASSQRVRGSDLELYNDDNCSNKLMDLDPGVDCNALAGVYTGMRIWSIKVPGANCMNITDTSFSGSRCQAYQDGILGMYESDGTRRRANETVELFSDDNCAIKLTDVKQGDNCSALSNIFGGMRVWSIRYRGQCQNITDTSYKPACEMYAR